MWLLRKSRAHRNTEERCTGRWNEVSKCTKLGKDEKRSMRRQATLMKEMSLFCFFLKDKSHFKLNCTLKLTVFSLYLIDAETLQGHKANVSFFPSNINLDGL